MNEEMWKNQATHKAHWKDVFHCRGVTGIFIWGGKGIFPDIFPRVKCFFPVKNSHFGRPKTNFHCFQKWKAKKKKKKKRPSPLLITFPTSISNFPPSLLPFSFFSSQFSALFHFSLPLSSRYISKNFPVRSLWGALCPNMPPCLLHHCFIGPKQNYECLPLDYNQTRNNNITKTNSPWDIPFLCRGISIIFWCTSGNFICINNLSESGRNESFQCV